MPIYEYLCQSGEHRFEAKQKFSDPPLASCVTCGQPVTKLISAPAIMFKGSGWYVTDYSDKLKEPKAEPAATNGKDQAKSGEAKPAEAKVEVNGTAASAPAPASSTPTSSTGTSTSPTPAST